MAWSKVPRRALGALVLVLAVTAVVLVRAVAHPGITGSAAAAPLPGPPTVGACLRLAAGLPAVTDCAAPHDLEVTAGVSADATPPSRSQCAARGAEYLPPLTVDGWLLPVDVETRVLPAPPGERAGGRGWQVCTVRPESHTRYTGTVRGMTLPSFRPDVFGRCAGDVGGLSTPCTAAHRTEELGTIDLPYAGLDLAGTYFGVDLSAATLPDAVTADLTARCAALTGRLTGAADPTYGGRLGSAVEVRTAVPTAEPGGLRVYAACRVTPPPDRVLTASVIGLGDRDLPLG